MSEKTKNQKKESIYGPITREQHAAQLAIKHANAFLDEAERDGVITPRKSTRMAVPNVMRDMGTTLSRLDDTTDRKAYVSDVDSEIAKTIDQKHYRATHDKLTGALNIDGFEEFMEETKTKPPQALIYIDLTNLKAINDNITHKRGNEVLQSTFNILSDGLRSGDAVARVGGDEFIIVLSDRRKSVQLTDNGEGMSTEEVIENVTRRISENTQSYLQDSKNQDLVEQGFDIAVGGVYWQEGETLDSIIEEAEKKMKEHKKEQHEALGNHR